MVPLICVLIGAAAGVSAGLFGIGGGIILVPAMMFFLQFSQRKAQGTSLVVLLLPVGLIAVMEYWKRGEMDLVAGGWIIGGFLFGSLFGSKIALGLPDVVLRRVFAVFLILVAIQMLFKK